MMNTKTERRDDPRHFAITMVALAIFCIASLLTGCAAQQPVDTTASDATVNSGVAAGLAADPRLEDYTLTVKTDNGNVHLSGLVETEDQRDIAEQIAAAYPGVAEVDNYIRFGDPSFQKKDSSKL